MAFWRSDLPPPIVSPSWTIRHRARRAAWGGEGDVVVPADLLGRLDELKPWFDRSVENVSGLKPKKTAR